MKSDIDFRSGTKDDTEKNENLVFGVSAEYVLMPDVKRTNANLIDIEANFIKRGIVFEFSSPIKRCCFLQAR